MYKIYLLLFTNWFTFILSDQLDNIIKSATSNADDITLWSNNGDIKNQVGRSGIETAYQSNHEDLMGFIESLKQIENKSPSPYGLKQLFKLQDSLERMLKKLTDSQILLKAAHVEKDNYELKSDSFRRYAHVVSMKKRIEEERNKNLEPINNFNDKKLIEDDYMNPYNKLNFDFMNIQRQSNENYYKPKTVWTQFDKIWNSQNINPTLKSDAVEDGAFFPTPHPYLPGVVNVNDIKKYDKISPSLVNFFKKLEGRNANITNDK